MAAGGWGAPRCASDRVPNISSHAYLPVDMLADVAALDYELVAELERKSLSDEDMTGEELALLAAVVRLSQPQSGPPGGFVIDEGEEFPPEADEVEAEWDR